MYPILFEAGGLTVTSFGVFIALSFLAAGWWAAREMRASGHTADAAWDLAVYAAVGGIVGAKLYYMVLNFPLTVADPWGMLLSRSGLVWYGGFIGGAAAVLYRIGRAKLPVWTVADAAAPALALGYAIGRFGCFMVGDDYGRPTNAPWAVAFPEGAPPSTAENLRAFGVDVPATVPADAVLAVHPTQLYETAMSLVIFAVILRLKPRLAAPGTLFFVWLALAGVERFVVEIFRAKDDRLLGPVSVAQVISLLLVAGGIAAAMAFARRGGGAAPVGTRAATA